MFADGEHFGVGQVVHPAARLDVDGRTDLVGDVVADAVDVLKGDGDAFPRRDVDASNPCHACLPFVAVPSCRNLFSQLWPEGLNLRAGFICPIREKEIFSKSRRFSSETP